VKSVPTLPLLTLLLLTPTAGAGVITGRVVDSLGNGVGGVNIAAEGSSTPTVTNGGTDPDGFFTTTISPDGVYDLFFEPPAPPATTHLTRVLTAVNVSGTVDLGNVVLAPGVALTGRCVRAVGGSAVPGVNLDLIADGANLPVVGDSTDALGQFSIAVPTGPIEVRFKTDGTGTPLLAPLALDLSLSSGTNIGDVLLQPGFVLSAIVRRQSNNAAVVNADIDLFDSLTGDKIYTPSDNTDSAGFVDVVVAAGTYDFEVGPQFADRLVSTTLLSQTVSANTFLGTILLQPGVVLSGTIQDYLGNVYKDIDVDLRDSATQAKVTLTGDNTDETGFYAVVVPTGIFDVEFEPPLGLPLGSQTIPNVTITGDTTLDGTLPPCVFVYCTAKPSSIPGCVPALQPPCTASLSGGPGSADIVCGPVPGGSNPAILVYTTQGAAASPAQTPFGFLCIQTGAGFFRVGPPRFPGGSPGTCSGSYTFDFGAFLASGPKDPNLVAGATVDVQIWYRDPANVGFANLSEAGRFQLEP
jgi:hypothetical protein